MILVTGNYGYIGSVMTGLLKDSGYNILGLDSMIYRGSEFIENFTGPDRQITKDVRDITPNDLEGITDIIHLAALSNDPLGELNPALTDSINYEATVKVARIAKEVGVERFLFASSCSMYGISDSDAALTEDGALNPITSYARTKVLAEKELSQLADDNFHPVLMRNATAYGVSPMLRLGLVVNNLVARAHTTGKVSILSDGKPWRPIIHVEDLCRAFKAVLEAPIQTVHNQAFNVGLNEENYQVRDIAHKVEKVVPDCTVEILNQTGSDERSYRVDFSRIQKMVPGFQPMWNLERGIQQLYEAYRENGFTEDDFESSRYFRIKWINQQVKEGILNNDLRYVHPQSIGIDRV